ncbi:MAG: rRNA pseudouridine synthase [Firmicutes bacterium]|nr:rRNA pseudouridine synthase [Bacillota bacterium]
MVKQRLQKILAEHGLASRRLAEGLISSGHVAVNGVIISELGFKADATVDSIIIDGQPLPKLPDLRYMLLHKPIGYLCSVKDEHGKKSVLSLLPKMPERLYPVGRLDYNSSGLLLLTNDGALTNILLHPSYKAPKTYRADVSGPVSVADVDKLRNGVLLEDGPTAPARVNVLRRAQGSSTLEITIYEGRKRQIRRMCQQIGHPVRQLIRLRFGPLSLGQLKPGQWRELNSHEVRVLKNEQTMRRNSKHGR